MPDTSARMDRRGQWSSASAGLPADRSLSGTLLTILVLLAGAALAWLAARAAVDAENNVLAPSCGC